MEIKTSVEAPMTKDLLMKYTFFALCVLVAMSFISFGFDSIVIAVISVSVAVVCDYLLSLVMGKKGPLNTMSAAVFGLIVTLSYSFGMTSTMVTEEFSILGSAGVDNFLYPALISAVGLIVFKKIQGLAGRKYVNPAAISKLLIISLLIMVPSSSLLPVENAEIFDQQNRLDARSLLSYYADPSLNPTYPYTYGTPDNPLPDILYTMLVQKYQGWIGGVSGIAVIAVGIALFALLRGYIKWRITLAYLLTTLLFSIVIGYLYGGDIIIRILFHLFAGGSIFLAFFMATDPATTPLTHLGQTIFGIGLGILTVLIQFYMNFLGGSILALIIMNLTSPILDNVGKLRPTGKEKIKPKLPKAKQFTAVKTYNCIRCGACMTVCSNGLSPALIKEAFDKQNVRKLMKLNADYCAGCSTCNFVCPARIDLDHHILGYPLIEEEARKIEHQFLKGTKDENLGIYMDVYSAKSSTDVQDGGVVTALLVSGIEKGMFDASIVVKRTDGYWAEAVIAENVEEIMEAKGTKYIRVPMMSKLEELIAKGKRKIALVGTACQVRAARKIQQLLLHEYADLELFIIGLFCFECFEYKKLKEETARLLDVDLDRVEKTLIRKGKYTVRVDGKDHSVKVEELSNAVEPRCFFCPDFTAEYSDISVGSVGSDEGYSTVILRSDIGKKLFDSVDLAKGKVNKEEITKLAILKKARTEMYSLDD
jgi:coenzyme F420-reducing hydrogenase beta subunit/Na+-translocating ferredoxin:NAD+ oxidoreductase RnfD subunit